MLVAGWMLLVGPVCNILVVASYRALQSTASKCPGLAAPFYKQQPPHKTSKLDRLSNVPLLVAVFLTINRLFSAASVTIFQHWTSQILSSLESTKASKASKYSKCKITLKILNDHDIPWWPDPSLRCPGRCVLSADNDGSRPQLWRAEARTWQMFRSGLLLQAVSCSHAQIGLHTKSVSPPPDPTIELET